VSKSGCDSRELNAASSRQLVGYVIREALAMSVGDEVPAGPGRAGDINLRALLVYGCGRVKKTTASFRDALF